MLRAALPRLGLACALFLVPAAAEAQVLRFSTTASGKIIGIGNTLGLAKELNANGPGTKDSIGTFISLLPISDDTPADLANPWPLGTTYDWTKNGSTAVLSLPPDGDVLYAELLWGGGYNYGGEDVTASLDAAVLLAGAGSSTAVLPDPTTKLTIAQLAASGFPANYYLRSANVTAFVKAHGGGTYSVSGVPATQSATINSLNAAGWTLAVVVHDPTAPVRNLSVFVGGSFVDENSQQDYTVSGFCTSPQGEVKGHVTISAIEGDANLTGDQLLIAPTAADTFVGLEGPNNPADNFFCSQINGPDGQLDTSGSFGNANHDAATGTNVSGGRQGWDVTTVSVSSVDGQLKNAQTSAVLRTITTGDSYVPTMAALAIDVNAPDFTGAGSKVSLSASSVTVGDTLTVTLDLANDGQVTADAITLKLPLPAGLSLTSFKMDGQSGDINHKPVDGTLLASGVDAGSLAGGENRQVVLTVSVDAAPAGAQYQLQPSWGYAFQICAAGAPLNETFAQSKAVGYTTSSSSSSSSSGSGGGGAGGGTGGSTTGKGGSDTTGGGTGANGGVATGAADSGCGCSTPGDTAPAPGALLALLGLAGLLGARRRSAR